MLSIWREEQKIGNCSKMPMKKQKNKKQKKRVNGPHQICTSSLVAWDEMLLSASVRFRV